jgi:nicotinamidase-related amidase
MGTKLLIIDPQNDFCDVEGAALPVPGASADLMRLGNLIARLGDAIGDITITLDSHPSVAIERVTFWRRADDEPVSPFTEITEAMVREGRYAPRDGDLRPQVLEYLRRLEAQGGYHLTVWPVHGVLGTWGHHIYAPLAQRITAWEVHAQRQAAKVLKGTNPLTEHYSAIRAEVPRADDPGTGVNQALIERLRPAQGERLLVAGEASSHCVRATVLDLLQAFDDAQRMRIVLLTDCMSPVRGFEPQTGALFEAAREAGAECMTSTAVLTALEQEGPCR